MPREREIWLFLLDDDLPGALLNYSAPEVERALWNLYQCVTDLYRRFKESQRQAAGK